jgi:hypothetical protein
MWGHLRRWHSPENSMFFPEPHVIPIPPSAHESQVLFASLQGYDAFVRQPYHQLRHPMAFYYVRVCAAELRVVSWRSFLAVVRNASIL